MTPRILRLFVIAYALITATSVYADTAQYDTIDEAIARGDLEDVSGTQLIPSS